MAVGVSPGHHHLLDVDGVLSHEPMAIVIDGMTKLSRPGLLFKLTGIHSKPKVRSTHRNGLCIWISSGGYGSLLTMIGSIDPVVYVKSQIGDLGFLIVLEKAGEQDFLVICDPITISVTHIPNIGGSSNYETVFPGQNAGGIHDLIGKDYKVFHIAITISVDQFLNPSGTRTRFRLEWI